jgi:hypothetical protein
VKQDLDVALTGFLRSTRIATADALIDYMRGRSEIVDPKRRTSWAKLLRVNGVSDPEKLSDEEVFRTLFKSESHWSGLVVESSCRQMWDGKNVPQKSVAHFDRSTIDPNTPPSEQALYLLRLLKGTGRSRTMFSSTSGNLSEPHQNDSRLLLCDVQLIIELDEAYSRAKAPYLLRFWFNPAVEKWQLIELLCFASKPDEMSTPGVPY